MRDLAFLLPERAGRAVELLHARVKRVAFAAKTIHRLHSLRVRLRGDDILAARRRGGELREGGRGRAHGIGRGARRRSRRSLNRLARRVGRRRRRRSRSLLRDDDRPLGRLRLRLVLRLASLLFGATRRRLRLRLCDARLLRASLRRASRLRILPRRRSRGRRELGGGGAIGL